jgi:hypothetical protein
VPSAFIECQFCYLSCHVIVSLMITHGHSCNLCHMSFISNVIHAKCHLCHLCQFMAFMLIHGIRVIHVNLWHSCLCKYGKFKSNMANSCQIMSFMSIYDIHVFLRHSFHLSLTFSTNSGKWRVGRGGQICLPRPSASASLSGRRQKCG